MAQKTEKEETEFKVPETTLSLCVNNCGFTGSPATNNMCQKCFSAAASAGINFSASDPSRSGSMRSAVTRSETSSDLIGILKQNREDRTAVASDEVSKRAVTAKREVNRCSDCRKKVGLTGFRCRCGELFCGEHRYSDRHDCSYDYKSVGREAIARENPVVKAAKIVKI